MREISEIIKTMREDVKPFVMDRLKSLAHERNAEYDIADFEQEFELLLEYAEKGLSDESSDKSEDELIRNFAYSIQNLLMLYGVKSIPQLDSLLFGFYQLDDEAREELKDFIHLKAKKHTDPERAKDIENIERLEI